VSSRATLSRWRVATAEAGARRGSLSLVSPVAVLVATKNTRTSPHTSFTPFKSVFWAVGVARVAVCPSRSVKTLQAKLKEALGLALSTAPP
jgi:hypothetical protein